MNAEQNYYNLDKMMTWMNENYNDTLNLFYSTPSLYVKNVSLGNVTFPTKYDDMFPYSDDPDSYWTGYYSSRANDKEYVRRASYFFDASNQLYSEAVLNHQATSDDITKVMDAKFHLFDALGINQHHDAVSGTAKQAVANDYAERLFKAMESNNKEYGKLIQENLFIQTGMTTTSDWEPCAKTNSTYLDCPIANFA